MFEKDKKIPYVTIGLVVLNAVVFFCQEIMRVKMSSVSIITYGAAFTPSIIEGREYYRLFTSTFIHFSMEHIMNNMFVLLIIGRYLERSLGRVRYLILYLVSGIGASLLSLLFDLYTKSYGLSAGASGAIFGVKGGLLYLAVKNRGKLDGPSENSLLIVIAVSLADGFFGSGIDNAAHIGGLITGILLAVILRPRPKFPKNYWGDKW